MSTNQFRLSIGAKRQVTLPAEFLEQLQLPERGELLFEIIGDHAVVTPMVTVPRTQLPQELRRVFESRRGAHPTDIPLAQFLKEVGYEAPAEKAAAPRLSMQQRLASLTPNERKSLEAGAAESPQQLELRPMGLTEREKQVLEQATVARSPRQIAHQLGLAERTVKSHLSSIERKLGIERKQGRLWAAARDEVRSAGS
jgi:DNA-binding CsgD family transcriptional regulator/bifunctional DNA-binding transcriptional regulator/antitoxin component of YhaV-PrlF toxin-antitoxin module